MRSLLRPFVLAVTLILALTYAYLGWRLATGRANWFALALPFLAVWFLPAIYWNSDRSDTGVLLKGMQWLSFLCMGFLSFLFLFTLARDLVLGALVFAGASFFKPGFSARGNLAIVILSALALVIGMIRAFGYPRVRKVRVPIQNLEPGFEGLTIAQISDLHVGPTLGRAYVEEVVRKVNSLAPDLIALTGDFADGGVAELRKEIAPLSELSPRERIFYVPGNHEYYWDGSGWIRELQALGAKPLLNAGIPLEYRGARLFIGGVLDPAAALDGEDQGPDPRSASRGSEGAKLRILLAHQPQIASEAAQAGFDLQLSGHTHGGQFWPWVWVARRVHRGLLHGLSRVGRMWVYVSAGTGTWGPPVRLGTSTEITLLELVRA